MGTKKMQTQSDGGNTKSSESVNRRLDALIRVIIETLYERKNKKFNEATAIRLLHSSGLTPTEIAKILGKKGPTAISPYLYDKKTGKSSLRQSKRINLSSESDVT